MAKEIKTYKECLEEAFYEMYEGYYFSRDFNNFTKEYKTSVYKRAEEIFLNDAPKNEQEKFKKGDCLYTEKGSQGEELIIVEKIERDAILASKVFRIINNEIETFYDENHHILMGYSIDSPFKLATPSQILKFVGKDNNCFSEKANRHNTGKIQWSLVDFKSLENMVKVLEFGAKKYSADNWKKGLYTKEIIESLLRHVFCLMSGEYDDKESGLSHTGHILANAMFLDYMIREKKEFDNINK